MFTCDVDEIAFFERLCKFNTQLYDPRTQDFIDQLEYWGLVSAIRNNISMSYFVSPMDMVCRATVTALGLRCRTIVSPYGGVIIIPLEET